MRTPDVSCAAMVVLALAVSASAAVPGAETRVTAFAREDASRWGAHLSRLAGAGGTNRTSGIRVAGLGAPNRERAEKIFYRGFTAYLTPTATFLDARRATIQAARDLYGPASTEAAQTELAWTAMGVVER
jgi:hypothetical protein